MYRQVPISPSLINSYIKPFFGKINLDIDNNFLYKELYKFFYPLKFKFQSDPRENDLQCIRLST